VGKGKCFELHGLREKKLEITKTWFERMNPGNFLAATVKLTILDSIQLDLTKQHLQSFDSNTFFLVLFFVPKGTACI